MPSRSQTLPAECIEKSLCLPLVFFFGLLCLELGRLVLRPEPTRGPCDRRPPRPRPSHAVAPSVSSEAAAAASKLVLLLDGVLPERDLGLQLEAVRRVVLRRLQPPVQAAADREFQDRPQGNGREGRLAVVDTITDHYRVAS